MIVHSFVSGRHETLRLFNSSSAYSGERRGALVVNISSKTLFSFGYHLSPPAAMRLRKLLLKPANEMNFSDLRNIAFALVLALTIPIACSVPKDIRARMTYCYNGTNTAIDSLINIHGYYKKKYLLDRYGTDTLFTNFMFFKDGIFLYEFADYSDNIPAYFRKIVVNPHGKEAHWFYKSYYWGSYKISGDTIKTQFINHPSLNGGWMAFEIWYKVINKDSLREVATKPLYYDKLNQDKSVMDLKKITNKPYPTAIFVSVDTLPNSKCWLKSKKWFWCYGRRK